MVLHLIGLGLGDEKDVTLKGMEAIKGSTHVYLEAYTSVLGGELAVEKLEAFYGCKITVADRQLVEERVDEIIEQAVDQDVSFLVIGDAFGATTHTDLQLRAQAMGVEVAVVHNASIMNAIGCCGLQLYNYGQAVSICFFRGPGTFWPDEPAWRPGSFYEKVAANRKLGLHSLCLVDIKVKEPNMEQLARGRIVYEKPMYMTVNTCVEQMLAVEKLERAAGNGGAYDENTLCVGLAKVGCSGQKIVSGTMKQLLDVDFGPPLHSFVIPGEMHHIEEEVFRTFQLPLPAGWVDTALTSPAPESSAGGGRTAADIDPAAVSAAVASWGEPAALQALIVDATARLVALAEAGGGSGEARAAAVPAPAPAPARAAATPAPPVAQRSATAVKTAADDGLEAGAFEGSVDAMDGFLDDLGEDSD